MKRLMIFLTSLLFAFAEPMEEIDVKIWKRIIFDIKLDSYRIHTPDPQMRAIFCKIPGIELVDDCKEATLIVDTKKGMVTKRECRGIPHLTNDYRMLLKNPNEIGAFFWLKGRPTIVIAGPRLKRFGLEVDIELEDFVEEIR